MSSVVRENVDYKALRASALYEADKNAEIRKSHDNPVIKEVYENYLGQPGSHKAHEILHTTYVARERYKK
jgi:NADP-reducing hydrogenase subunit HndD